MLNLFAKTADGRKQRLAKTRRRRLASEMQRFLQLEPLEERRLLASDVVIGANDRDTSYVRTPSVGGVVYSPIQDGAQIAADRILADLNAGLTVTIDTVNAAGLEEGNITLNGVNLFLTNAVNSALNVQADNDVVLGNSRVIATVGSVTLILNSDRDGSGEGRVEINAGSQINTNGGDVAIGGGLNPLTTPAVGTLASSDGVSIFGIVNAGDGNISILGQGFNGAADDSDGIFVEGTINTVLGDILMQGTGGNASGVGNDGVALNGGIVTSAGGNVSINGVGGGTGTNQNGVNLSNSVSAPISVTNGSLAISGAGSPTGTGVGVLLAAGADRIESLGSAPITIDATGSGGSSGLQSSGSIGGANAGGDITLITDGLELFGAAGNVQGTGNLLIRPATPTATIGVGGGLGTLNISDAEIASFIDGFASITIGDAAAGSGAVDITSVTFTDPVTIVGGSIQVGNGFTGDGGITLTTRDAATAGQDVNINSAFVNDSGGNVTINSGDNFNLALGSSITAMGTGTVTVNLDQSPNADAGVGSTATLGGTLSGNGGTSINGAADTDTLSLTTTIISLMVAASGANSGAITADTATINYTALEAINVTQQSNNANITFGATSETLTISEPAALSTMVASSAGTAVTLRNPAVSLTIDTGSGNDTVNVSSLGPTFVDNLFISDGDAPSNDTVNLNGPIAIGTGGLEVTALTVNVNADIAADDTVVLGDPVAAAALVSLGGVSIVTTNGLVQFASPVAIAVDSTINAGAVAQFNSTIGGTGNLAVTAVTDVIFAAAIGTTLTPLGSLTATSAGGQVLVAGDITTSGDQIFVSPTTTNTSAQTTFESQAGSVTFQSLLESSLTNDITVNSNGVAQFGGNVGANNPPQTLTVNTAGPFSIGTLVNANADLSIFVADTAGDTDDLTILTGGSIISAGGNVNLNAGDDFESQSGAILNGSVVTINVDSVAGDADATGGTAIIDGNITTGVLGNALNVNGGDDVDTFTPIAPIAASFDGGDPTTAPGDTLFIDGAGGTVTISETTIQVGANPPLNITNLENFDLTNTTTINYVGGAGNDTLTLSANPLPATTAVLQVAAGPSITFDPAVATAVGFLGGDGDDTFSVDVTNGVLNTTVTFDGQGNASSMPGDRISIFGAPAVPLTSLEFNFLNPNDGSVVIDGRTTINYVGLEPVDSVVTADEVTLNYSAAAETIAVSQVDTNITVDSTSGETTTFVAPNNNLTINTGGGADTVTIDGLNVNLAGGFSVNDASGPTDDTVIFANGMSTITTGRLVLPVPQIQVNADLSIDGDVLLGSATGTGQIQTSATLSSRGQVVFDEPINLTGATTVTTDADSLVSFRFAIDGNQDLNVTGGAGVEFLAENGVTTPVANLTATATMGSIQLNDFGTFGNQTYNSPVTTVAGGGTVDIVSSAGAVSFGSTIDNGSEPADSFVTNSDDVTTFGGAIGATDPLDALTVRASGTIVFATDVTVLNDIDISTADSGDDNLVIQSPAVISTGLNGSITLNVLDNVDIQAGSTINTSNFGITVDDMIASDDVGTGSIVKIDGTLNVGNPTNVVGGDDADTFSIAVQAGSAFDVSGGNPLTSPGDLLVIDAGGLGMTFDVAAGTITVAGAMPIVAKEIERIGLSNSSQLTINGDIGPEIVSIASDPNVAGGDLLTINGSLPYAISTIASLVYNGGDGDDLLTFDVTSGLPTTPVTFNGQGQADGSGDQINVLGTVITQALNYTAPGTDGNNGSIELDGSVVTYTGLELINAGNSTETILNFTTGLVNKAELQDVNGRLGTIELRDLGGTFEDTFIPNPTNSLTINLGDQGDTLAVNTLDAAYAASMIINGGAGNDDVQVDSVTIGNTPGRGLDVAGVETLGITNSTFSGNTADVGAGLRVVGGIATIDGSTFSGNTANGDAANQGGGGIFNGGVMTIQNGSMITGNTASGGLGSGGGILVGTAGTLTVLDSTISGNSANRAGGGVETQSANDLTLTNVTLDANVAGITPVSAAPGNGGGLHVTGNARTFVSGGAVTNNRAAAEGGGLWNDVGLMTINGGTMIERNTAAGDLDPAGVNTDLQGGGGIFNNGGSLDINDVGGAVIVQNNQASGITRGSGGGIMSIGGTVNMLNASILSNEAVRAGGGIEVIEGTVSIFASNIANNDVSAIDLLGLGLGASPGNGGGLHVTGGANVTISGGSVQNNSAEREGGGLWNSTGTMTVQNGALITNNTASGPALDDGGGGIFNNGGTLNITGATTGIQANTADGTSGRGGGIHSAGGTISITDALLDANTANVDGGGLYADGGQSITITDARIIGNTAGDSGGGAFINGSTTAISTTTFTGNQAQGNRGLDGDGGGLFVRGQEGSGNLTVTDSTFDSNSALGGGGGAFFVDIAGTINGGSFDLNQVTGNGTTFDTGGGGLAIVGETMVTTVSMSGVTVDGNTSPSAAGVGIVDSQVAIDNSVIRNNVATSPLAGAGGIGALATAQLEGDLLSIQNSAVINNTTAGEGGGLGIINGDISVFATTIFGNRATGGRGGGIGLLNNGMAGTATIRSSTLSMNTASESGGGIAVLNFGLDLENVTISTNDAGTVGGGIGYDSNVDFVNERISFSTITSNTSQAGGSNIAATGEPIDVLGSIINDGVAAAANVLNSLGFNLDSGNTSGFGDASDLNNADPLLGPLQDNGGPVFTHALLTGSPAIDAAGANGPATDARGIARPIDGELNGSLLFDIGAFESEAPFALIIDDVTVNEDAGTATITVRNIAAVAGGFTVDFATSGGTATQPADYATATGTLTFIGTENESQTFTVSIVDDAIVENAETVNISLSNPSNTMVDASDTGVLTINDNDVAILTVNDVTVDEGAGVATVTVTVNNAVDNGFTVDFMTSDGTAMQPDDYETATGTLNFIGTENESQTFTVSIVDDAIVENAETVNISLSNPSNVMVDASDTGVLTINDDDTAILTVNDVTVDEGAGLATVTVTVNNAVDNGFSVDFMTSDGTAMQPDDYSTAIGTLTFIGNADESQTFTVPIIDDPTAEAAETISIDLANPSNAAVDATDTAVINITDNEDAALTLDDVTVDEDAGTATVTVTLDTAVAGGLTVDFATTDAAAVQPGDYMSETGTLTFAGTAGETQTFSVSIVNDLLVEPNESLLVSLSNPSNPTVNVSDTALVTIADNDMATIEVADISVDEQAGNALVSVAVLNVGVQGGFTVDFTTVDGTATQPDDYALTTGTLTFGSTPLSQNIAIAIVGDAIQEGNQQFTVVLSNVVPLGANPAPVASINATDIGTVTITETPVTNVDIGTSIADAPDPVLAGGNLVYTVTVTNFGSSTATGVVSTTTLPAGLTGTTAVTSAGTVNVSGNIVTANIPMLAIGASEMITISSAVPVASGLLTADTNVTSIENDTNLTNNLSSENTTISVPPSAIINGTVTCDVFRNSPNVVNEPIANAVIFLDTNSDGRLDPGEVRTTTNPSGFYQFDNVAGTAANVTVQVPMTCNTIPDEPGVRRSVVAIGHISRSIASADIDLDGDLDLLVTGDMNLVANQDHSNSLTIVQDSQSGFTSSQIVQLGDRPQSVFAYQPNPMEPALIAVAAVGSSSSGGAVYTIQGQGSPVRHSGNGGPIDVLVDDLNVDGLPDVLSASLHQSILELRLGGSSDILTVNSQTSQILSIASGNLIDSPTREVVVVGYGHKPNPALAGQPTKLELYRADSSGMITRIASVDTPPEAVKVAVVDIIGNDSLDGFDDNVDEIVVLFHTGKMLVYPMVNGTIGHPIETQIGNGATAFDFSERLDANNEFIDFNRDGNVDVAVALLGNNSIELYVGVGNGQFSKFSTIDDVYAPSDLVVDDFNGDGFADIAVSSFYSETDVDGEPGIISRPGLTTILQLEIASRSVSISPNSATTEDFLFRSAIPQVMMDTTGDNRITALDALRVINVVDRNLRAEGEQVAVARAATDVNGDGRTSAIDALMIINYLSLESEGEEIPVMIDDLIRADDEDDDDRDELIAAFDLALTQGVG